MFVQQKGLWRVVLFTSPGKLLVVTPVTGCEGYPVGKNCVSQWIRMSDTLKMSACTRLIKRVTSPRSYLQPKENNIVEISLVVFHQLATHTKVKLYSFTNQGDKYNMNWQHSTIFKNWGTSNCNVRPLYSRQRPIIWWVVSTWSAIFRVVGLNLPSQNQISWETSNSNTNRTDPHNNQLAPS